MDPATYIADLNDGNGTNSSDLDIRCFFVPFCDTEECDRTVHPYPLDCPKCSTPLVTIFVAVLIITALFISFGNLGIILVITKNQSFHNSFNMFKCSLAIADLLVGVFVVPSGAFEMLYILRKPYDKEAVQRADVYINTMGEPVRYDSLCDRIIKEDNSGASVSLSIISVLSVMASIFHLVLLSVDRFFAVRCPIKYNQGRALNNRMASLLIVIIWTICIILSVVLPIALGPDHFRYGLSPPMIFVLKTANGTTGMLYAALALGLPYVSLLGLNIATAWMLFKKRGKIRRQPSNVSNSNNNSRRSSEVKATITLLVMVLVFTITTIPPMAAVSFYNISGTDVNAEAYLHTVIYCILILLLISNSAWNFIIYSWRNDNFRKALKELLQCKTNGRRRRPRWKKVKRLVMRNSERKQRRKKLARLAGSCDVNHSDKILKLNNGFRDVSIRSNDAQNHTQLCTMKSVTSSDSTSTNCTTVSNGSPKRTNDLAHCHSPTIPEEDDNIFFAEENPAYINDETKPNSEKFDGDITENKMTDGKTKYKEDTDMNVQPTEKTGSSAVSTQQTNCDLTNCHSPTIPEEDGHTFAETNAAYIDDDTKLHADVITESKMPDTTSEYEEDINMNTEPPTEGVLVKTSRNVKK